MTTLRRRLDPRLHLAAAIGWAVFAVVTLAALGAANLAANDAEERARGDVDALLGELATQVRDALSMNIEARRALLLATAAQVAALRDRNPPTIRRVLETVQVQVPEFGWLGVTDGEGRLLASSPEDAAGEDTAPMGWLREGRQRPFVGDQRALPAPGGVGGMPTQRRIDMAVPLDPGAETGVVAASLPWAWVEGVITKMQQAFNRQRELEVMIAARDGTLLIAPSHWLGQRLTPQSDLSEGGKYVVGTRTELRLADGVGLGWIAMVRQRADLTLAPVWKARRSVFLIVFMAGLLAAAAAVLVTRVLTRRLAVLAAAAESVRRGAQRTLAAPPGADEIGRIGATLAEVVGHLQAEKQSLLSLNDELDRRVAERTLRIERMADEARHAAVARERLRMARDLHDTLAHSLMALLTQVRLVRKLRLRMDATELDAELSRAEAVAASGLKEARAAIAQMRDNGVRDAGLGPAVQDLVRRFGERTGVPVVLDIEGDGASWADDRAETLFRIVEEALRNVERHAQARGVRVEIAAAGAQGVRLAVSDDGLGFDPAQVPTGHFGLRGMREQAALIGASFEVRGEPGRGTRIVVDLAGA